MCILGSPAVQATHDLRLSRGKRVALTFVPRIGHSGRKSRPSPVERPLLAPISVALESPGWAIFIMASVLWHGCVEAKIANTALEIHCYSSSLRFHFFLETSHYRLLSRWAALFEGCTTKRREYHRPVFEIECLLLNFGCPHLVQENESRL